MVRSRKLGSRLDVSHRKGGRGLRREKGPGVEGEASPETSGTRGQHSEKTTTTECGRRKCRRGGVVSRVGARI